MAQPSVAVFVRLEPSLAERLDEQCKRESTTKSDVIRRALEAYLEK